VRISVYCETCLASVHLPPPAESPAGEVSCPSKHSPVVFKHSDFVLAGLKVDRCSRCGSTAFFIQKDFDQRVGCAILLAGAVAALLVSRFLGGIWFVPVLLVFAAADFVLARRVGSVVICYHCNTEYRDLPDLTPYRPYDLHIAERDAELKTVRRMNP
jgi:hypothetical protein